MLVRRGSVAPFPPLVYTPLVVLPECKAENQMRQLKDRIRERFALQVGEKVRLGYGKAGAIIEVSDDDSVDEVVEAIIAQRVGLVEIPPPLINSPSLPLITISGCQRSEHTLSALLSSVLLFGRDCCRGIGTSLEKKLGRR